MISDRGDEVQVSYNKWPPPKNFCKKKNRNYRTTNRTLRISLVHLVNLATRLAHKEHPCKDTNNATSKSIMFRSCDQACNLLLMKLLPNFASNLFNVLRASGKRRTITSFCTTWCFCQGLWFGNFLVRPAFAHFRSMNFQGSMPE